MLHSPVHLAPVFFLLHRLTLVKFLLTFSQGYIHLCPSMIVNKHQYGHYGETNLLGGFLKFMNLAFIQKQLTVALCLMVVI